MNRDKDTVLNDIGFICYLIMTVVNYVVMINYLVN